MEVGPDHRPGTGREASAAREEGGLRKGGVNARKGCGGGQVGRWLAEGW